MRPCRSTRRTDGPYQVTHLQNIPNGNINAAHMKERRTQAISMIQYDGTAAIEKIGLS
jgi:hypothetical protein